MGSRYKQTFLQRRHTDGQEAREEVFNTTHYQRNTNQNYSELSLHTGQDGHHQNFTKSRCWIGVEKREPSYTTGVNVNGYSHYGEQYGGSLKKLKRELPYYPTVLLLDIYLEKNKIQKYTCIPMLIEHCLQQLRHGSKLNVHQQING